MPPRIPAVQCLRAQNSTPCLYASRTFSTTPSSRATTAEQKKRHRDPYAVAQAKARKAANLSRRQLLEKERASTLGDPVRGITTPFITSFDTALPPQASAPSASTPTPTTSAVGARTESGDHLNFYLSKKELETGISRSKWLVQPIPKQSKSEDSQETDISAGPRDNEFDLNTSSEINNMLDSIDILSKDTPEQREERMKQEHETAQEALRRISNLSLGSSKDRLRINTQRVIEVFGRHNTDKSLPPKPQAEITGEQKEKDPRIGPDTGSSEVQIGILTAKIRALADGLELRGGPDKVNKRNLRLLVHRRAKLLKYLRRKERGGPRWQNLIDTLGLTEGTWKGEISM